MVVVSRVVVQSSELVCHASSIGTINMKLSYYI
jgi:hypothetical protein